MPSQTGALLLRALRATACQSLTREPSYHRFRRPHRRRSTRPYRSGVRRRGRGSYDPDPAPAPAHHHRTRRLRGGASRPSQHAGRTPRRAPDANNKQGRPRRIGDDFLGVTGANPRTGELDVITPPPGIGSSGSSSSSPPSSSLSCSSSSSDIPRSSLLAGLSRRAREARDAYEAAVAKRAAGLARAERRAARARRRKEAVREAVRQMGVKWTRDETGWWSSPPPAAQSGAGAVAGSGPGYVHDDVATGCRRMRRRRHRRSFQAARPGDN